jgi:DNA-binding SARP family transcriptional activator
MVLDSALISIQLLGPLSASLGTRTVTPNAAKQREILALLALNAGRIVTVSTVIEELWGDHPPRSSATTLQTYIFHLRSSLAVDTPRERVASEFLRTRHSGYQLECHTDVEEFRRLARAGREAAEAGDPQAVSELLGRALDLWRGPALVDVRQGRILEAEAASLEETRLGVLERRIQADLALHRHGDILGELTMLAAQHPMNENFRGFLMIALYRAGHVARALDAFQQLRTILGDELGIDPSPWIRRLHQAILSGDLTEDMDTFLTQDRGLSRPGLPLTYPVICVTRSSTTSGVIGLSSSSTGSGQTSNCPAARPGTVTLPGASVSTFTAVAPTAQPASESFLHASKNASHDRYVSSSSPKVSADASSPWLVTRAFSSALSSFSMSCTQ